MFEYIKKVINIILQCLGVKKCEPSKQEQFMNELEEAYSELQKSLNIFDHISEEELIDYAIFNINAAETKYIYLIKKAKDEKITADLPLGELVNISREKVNKDPR